VSLTLVPQIRRLLGATTAGAGICVAIALWVAFAPDHRPRPSDRTSPRAAPTASTVPLFGPDPFGEGHGRFAAVVDGRLWLVDARSQSVRGVQGIDRAQIVAVSGSSLLVRSRDLDTSGSRYLVDGSSGTAVRAADGAWIPRLGGGWWITDATGLRSGSERVSPPPDFTALAQVNAGFVIAPSNGEALALFDPRSGSTRTLGRPPYTRYLGGDASRVALADPRCPVAASQSCSIEIVDVGTRVTISVPVPFSDQFVREAVFSGDGRSIAIWGTRGVALVDPANGAVTVALNAARLATTPLAFTPDAARLLVLEDPVPNRQVVVLRADSGRFVRSWVSKQQLEQVVALASG
jgi:hypothetical protein